MIDGMKSKRGIDHRRWLVDDISRKAEGRVERCDCASSRSMA